MTELHYENFSGTLVRRDGMLHYRCPCCGMHGSSKQIRKTCEHCGWRVYVCDNPVQWHVTRLKRSGWRKLGSREDTVVLSHPRRLSVRSSKHTYALLKQDGCKTRIEYTRHNPLRKS